MRGLWLLIGLDLLALVWCIAVLGFDSSKPSYGPSTMIAVFLPPALVGTWLALWLAAALTDELRLLRTGFVALAAGLLLFVPGVVVAAPFLA
ncbi:hypothetical protein Pla86_42290 [Planctomycetes bacterium Pla86]|uniref:Uncharacterized protein n=2 Tax=Engelhardtia mirabilis TaxID=2528011 RepID=A0A518BQ69_9BACT|nr:hypothetical protein Pla133_42300 [Planctomycetes bacterium Pla133]QDV03441.1 hypothetical protein Pla86_42290 [Planctomycetes bacterium Pla86]